jgi:hypothetical protein
MKTTIGYHFQAWGRKKLPENIIVKNNRYQLERIFKHDFFAATALYQLEQKSNAGETPAITKEPPLNSRGYVEDAGGTVAVRVVLKLGRHSDFLGLPLRWLGRAICQHETDNLQRLQNLSQIPHLLDKYGDTGLVYEYIKGSSLDENPDLPDDFFNRLEKLLKQIHLRRVAYVDLNKRGNILLGCDNLPYLIDFQIACHIPELFRPLRILTDSILRILQKEDFYHLNKHKRHLSGHLMDVKQIHTSRQKSTWIKSHRKIARPLTRLRRKILYFLFHRGHLSLDDTDHANPESNPHRWKKRE